MIDKIIKELRYRLHCHCDRACLCPKDTDIKKIIREELLDILEDVVQ